MGAPVSQTNLPTSDPVDDLDSMAWEYYTRVYSLTLSILNDPDEAEDAAQETFIAAYLNRHQYQPGSNYKAWLFTIAVNYCRRRYNKRQRQDQLIAALQETFNHNRPAPTPEDTALVNESNREIWLAVGQLDKKHRLPILLRYAHHLSIAEISQILNLRPGTVHSRLYYACQKLRTLLD
jgi:RNA polymerase sigma-70 factor (ECF subfamily)